MPSKRAKAAQQGQRIPNSPEELVTARKNGRPPHTLASSGDDLLQMPYACLIRIPKRQDRERAIVAFTHVPRARCRLSDHRYLVTREHIMALQRAGIAFEDMTDSNN
jgi:hypothetical protein